VPDLPGRSGSRASRRAPPLRGGGPAALLACVEKCTPASRRPRPVFSASRPQTRSPPTVPAFKLPPAPQNAPSSAYHSAVSNEDDRWNCNGCGNTNYMWREFCSRCRRPNPSPPAALLHSKKVRGRAAVGFKQLMACAGGGGGVGGGSGACKGYRSRPKAISTPPA
jgi:hypothetical protein